MDNTPTYRPWEARWSPNNRAAVAAHRATFREQAVQRRAEREAAEAAAKEARQADPEIVARRAAAEVQAAAIRSAMCSPPTRRCIVIPQRSR
jgi:hypothetical protein